MWNLARWPKSAAYIVGTILTVLVIVGISQVVSRNISPDRQKDPPERNISADAKAWLLKSVQEINKSMPMDVYAGIRVESVTAVDSTMEYLVTLKNFSKTFGPTPKQKRIAENLYMRQVCGSDGTMVLWELGLRLRFVYQGADGGELWRFDIGRTTCAITEAIESLYGSDQKTAKKDSR